jgi:hypothetical protein
VGVVIPWEWPGNDPAAFEAAVQRAEQVFVEVMPRLKKRGQRLSNKKGMNFAPKLLLQEPETKEARVNETSLAEAMRRLIDRGTIQVNVVAGGAHELVVVENDQCT